MTFMTPAPGPVQRNGKRCTCAISSSSRAHAGFLSDRTGGPVDPWPRPVRFSPKTSKEEVVSSLRGVHDIDLCQFNCSGEQLIIAFGKSRQ